MSKENFIKELTTDLPIPPSYFFHDAKLNRKGYESMDTLV